MRAKYKRFIKIENKIVENKLQEIADQNKQFEIKNENEKAIIVNFLYLVLIIPGLYLLNDPQLSRYWFFILLLIYLIIYSRLYRLTKN